MGAIASLLIVRVDLMVAVNVGVILAMMQFLRQMAESVETKPVAEESLTRTLAGLGLQEVTRALQA